MHPGCNKFGGTPQCRDVGEEAVPERACVDGEHAIWDAREWEWAGAMGSPAIQPNKVFRQAGQMMEQERVRCRWQGDLLGGG